MDRGELLEMLKSLHERKAIRPDEMSGHNLKICKQMVDPMYDMIKCTVESGEVPQKWKRADVIPIYKRGNKEETLNYRSVSLTSIVCKLCERVIKKQQI